MRLAAAIAALWLACAGVAQAAEPSFPQLTGRVVDAANLLDAADEAAIEARLRAHEDKTTTQFVVVTLPSLEGYDIADYGVRLGRHWGIGQKGVNNGALLIVAPNDRAVRIEVGYGLEGTLTDALTSVIINGAILPRFRNGDFPGGIRAGVDDVLTVLDGNGEELRQRAEAMSAPDQDDWIAFAFVALILGLWVLILVTNFRRHGWKGLLAGGGGSSRSSRGWSSGSSGGFRGGGGFSGGGGSFGGGGSSGRW